MNPTHTDKQCHLQLETVYTFNVSPSDKYQYEKAPQSTTEQKGEHNRLQSFTKYWTKFFQEFTISEIQFHLQTELSEPVFDGSGRQVSRLHYHGYIKFPNVSSLRWFLLYGTVLLDKVCRYTIGSIEDPLVWYNYISKQSFLKLPMLTQFGGIKEFYEDELAKIPSVRGKVRRARRAA